ncbi:MAG: sigma-70 family RNA polymerase sigma factor [Acidaminobacter sp.]|uniref:sigma-70 family RNA polymerase sigma factor n=1 Tax=Acidaminobacter sp. TaxID=1872102 RepID=UPI00137DF8F8|nr:sigma-70 family RNA polymerase sigma factor [Acidaminobacter sp.]MZQ99581.1 sigma-70 family RNA polymerase sigma factor [Acidaminobacter sp.]
MEITTQIDRQQLIVSHLPLVHKAVNKMHYNGIHFDREDLIQVGVLGLMDAIDRFQPQLGVPFEYYAGVRIRGTITDTLRRAGHFSKEKMAALSAFYKEKALMEQRLMRSVSDDELCDYLNLTDKEQKTIFQTMAALPAVSLEEILFDDESGSGSGSGPSLQERLVAQNTPSPEEVMMKASLSEALKSALVTLEERDQLLLQLYYVESLSFKDIAAILEVSVPRVSQLHTRALMALRIALEAWR